MSYGLPNHGDLDWDDDLDNSVEALHADVQTAKADALAAKNDAAYAKNIVNSVSDISNAVADAEEAADTATTKASLATGAAASAQSYASQAQDERVAAEAARDAAEAVGSTNDAIIAGRINTPASLTATALTASTADLAVSRTTRPKHAPALGIFYPEAEGAVGDGTTDDTAAILAADTAAQANGGGTVLFDPNKTYRVNGRLARSFGGTTSVPTSKPVRWTCFGASSASGQWVTNALNGGATLDLRYDGTDGLGQAKIDTRGCGRFEIDHLNIVSGGSDNFPILQTTNTTVHLHHNYIRGNFANQGTACVQDAFLLGGTSNTIGDGLNAPFQGYGSRVHDNHFDRIRVGVWGRTYCNSITIESNTFTPKCGNDGTVRYGGAIEFTGFGSGSGYCVGNIVRNNTIEVTNYKYGVALGPWCSTNFIGPNGFWDPQAGSTHVAGVYVDTNAIFNRVDDGYHNPIYALVYDKGMTTTVRTSAQSRASFYPQRTMFRDHVYSLLSNGLGMKVTATSGDYSYMKCSNGSAASPSYPEVILGTSPALLVTDLVTTSGSNIVTSASSAFVAEQKYLPIKATGIPSGTVILRRVSATQLELSADCTVTATGVTAQIGNTPGAGTNTDEIGFTRRHVITKGAIGAAAPVAAGAGTVPNGAAASATGTDVAFQVTITTASTGTGVGGLATVSYGIAYTNPGPKFGAPCPRNAAAAAAIASGAIYLTSTNSVLTINAAVALPVSTTLIFDIVAVQ